MPQHYLRNTHFPDIQEWIDYAIRKARETRFDMKSFGGIKVYGTEFWLEKKRRSQAKREGAKAKRGPAGAPAYG